MIACKVNVASRKLSGLQSASVLHNVTIRKGAMTIHRTNLNKQFTFYYAPVFFTIISINFVFPNSNCMKYISGFFADAFQY